MRNEFLYIAGKWRFWAAMILLVVLFLSLGGCAKTQYVGVETDDIKTPAELMVPPEELPKRDIKNTGQKDVARAWGEDRLIGADAIRRLKDLQAHNRAVEAGRQKNRTK